MPDIHEPTPAEVAEISARVWAPHAFAEWASDGAWLPYTYLAYIGERIGRAVVRGGARIIINAPFRHGKSELGSFWTPTWYVNCLPHKRVSMCSAEKGMVTEIGRRVRNELETNEQCWTTLSPDSTAAGRWNTPEGGGMICAGVGGSIIGRGMDLGIIDDVHKNWDEANSPERRKQIVDWFMSTFYSRREPNASIIIIMTRWHAADLAGWLIEEHADDWEVLSFPAIAEKNDLIGRKPGEALCPERFDIHELMKTKAATYNHMWEALYQQNPQSVSSSRVYHKFKQGVNIAPVELTKGSPIDLSLDFNVNPGMHASIGQHWTMTDRFTSVHEIHGPRMRIGPCIDEFVRRFGKQIGKGKAYPMVNVYGDATGDSDNVVTTHTCYTMVKRALDKAGIPHKISHPRRNPPLISSIEATNSALEEINDDGKAVWLINKRCGLLTRDLRELQATENDTINKSDQKKGHMSDAERYRINRVRPIRDPLSQPKGKFGYGTKPR